MTYIFVALKISLIAGSLIIVKVCSELQKKSNCHIFSSTKIFQFKTRSYILKARGKIGQEMGANLGKWDNVVSDEF